MEKEDSLFNNNKIEQDQEDDVETDEEVLVNGIQ